MEMGTTKWPANLTMSTTMPLPQAPATIHPLQTRSGSLPISPSPHSLSASLLRGTRSGGGTWGDNNDHQPLASRLLGSVDDLKSLDDRLNLTGLVERVGTWPAKSGGFSDVWEGRYGKTKVAVKVMREVGTQRGTLTRRLIRETRAWSKLYHRNVLPLLGFAYGCGSDTLASLVSPWAPGGTAPAYLRGKSLSERFKTITEVADGLSYLHRHDVVHGDLKGDNILIGERGEAQLADFGLSKLVSEVNNAAHLQSKTTSVVGSVRWMARELFLSDSQTVSCVNKDTDVWSYGMTVLELFTDKLPYHEERNDFSIVILIHHGKLPRYPDKALCHFPIELWELCNDCWHGSPSLRPSMRLIARRMWDLELCCKRVEKRRTDTRPSESSDTDENPRVRKSPKLNLLPELVEEYSYPAPSLLDPYSLARPSSASPYSSSSPTTSMPTTIRTSSPRNGEFTLAHFQQGHPIPDFEYLPPWRPSRTGTTRTLSMPTTPRHRLMQLHTLSEPNYQNSLAHSDSALSLERYQPPHVHMPSPLGLIGVSGHSPSRSTSFSGSLDYTYTQDPRTDPLSYAPIDSSASAYLECFPGLNMSQQQSSSALSLRHDHLASATSYSPMQTPTDSQYPSDKLHLPMFSDSLIFSNYLAEEPAEVYDHYASSSQSETHTALPSTSSSQSSLARHDELPPSFTEMRHGLFSPAMSDVTPLLGALDTFPPSSSLTDSFGPWDSGDFGDFDNLDDPYDGGLALFGGVAIDENINEDQEPVAHSYGSVGSGSGSANGNGIAIAITAGNQNPITPLSTPRSSPHPCTLSELHSRTPTTPTANSAVYSPPQVASEA